MPQDTPTHIQNHHALTEWFGYWPSFHDAYVRGYQPPTGNDPTRQVTLHTWEMTSALDTKGYFILRKHVLVTLRFTGIHAASLDAFSEDPTNNILAAVEFSPPDEQGTFRVTLDSVMSKDATFSATAGEVVSVVPDESAPRD